MKKILGIFAIAAMTLFGSTNSASAAVITGAASDFNISWSATCGSITCSGTANFDVISLSSTELIMDITLNNTTTSTGLYLVGFGFNMSPTATGLDDKDASNNTNGDGLKSPGTYIDQARLNITFPNFNTLTICTDQGGNGSCGGGPANQGIPDNTSDKFRIGILGNFTGNVTLSTFALKYAGNPTSYEFGACETNCTSGGSGGGQGGGPVVPEPATLMLLGSGLALVAAKARSARKASNL